MLNLILVLLGIKLLLPSKKQRKKRRKARARRKRLMKLAARMGRKKMPAKAVAPVKKTMGIFRRVRLALKALTVICISIPLIDLTVKGVKLGRKAYAMLPKKGQE